jgi:uncharacterized coiled-coil DUF342 family protein
MSDEITPEMQKEIVERVKQFESKIVEKLNSYRDQLKEYEEVDNRFRKTESKAYALSQRLVYALKRGQDCSDIERELSGLVNQVDESRLDTIESLRSAFTTLQSLYQDHTQYLIGIAQDLKQQNSKLESTQQKKDSVFIS